MYCPNCGKKNKGGGAKCVRCGTAFDAFQPVDLREAAISNRFEHDDGVVADYSTETTDSSVSKGVIVCAIGLLVAFFLPWVQFLGMGMTGYLFVTPRRRPGPWS